MRPFVLIQLASLALTFANAPFLGAQDVQPDDPGTASLPPARPMPDPLIGEDGTPVDSAAAWHQRRRPEIEQLFRDHVYGELPAAEPILAEVREEAVAFGGLGVRRQVRLTSAQNLVGTPPLGNWAIDLLIHLPAEREAPVPVLLGLNFRGNHTCVSAPEVPLSEDWIPGRSKGVVDHRATEESRGSSSKRWPLKLALERGFGVITLYHGQVAPDDKNATEGLFVDGDRTGALPRAQTSVLSSWAWGIHRAVDYCEQATDIDGSRVAVLGHSRNGKTALWAGATDPRIALVISNQSGCCGAALSRRRVGETVGRIQSVFPHWFRASFVQFADNEDHLPVDQHQLIALVAPRPVLVCSAEEDRWADPEGEFLAAQGAGPVYELLGVPGLGVDQMPGVNQLVGDTVGYHIRPGKHNVGAADWRVFLDFAERHLADR